MAVPRAGGNLTQLTLLSANIQISSEWQVVGATSSRLLAIQLIPNGATPVPGDTRSVLVRKVFQNGWELVPWTPIYLRREIWQTFSVGDATANADIEVRSRDGVLDYKVTTYSVLFYPS